MTQDDPTDPERVYATLAPYYDLVYGNKDYRRETEALRGWVRRFSLRPTQTLLDVACGTGNHLTYLQRHFDCVGLDASPEMLRRAHRKFPKVQFLQGDMRTFALGRRFDVITCLFSAIGYVESTEDLHRAIGNFAAHLEPGGVLVVEPWLRPDQYQTGHIAVLTAKTPQVQVVRMNVSERKGRRSIMDMHYLIGRPKRRVEYLVDHHELMLFTAREMREAFVKAGLSVRYFHRGLSPGRGAYVATLQRSARR